jgi:PST family polysaccharide transporter
VTPIDEITPAEAPSLHAIVRALSWVGAGHVIGQAFWFGSLIALATLLPPSAFGTVTLGLLMVTAATRLMEAGTRGSIIVSPRLTRDQVATSLAVNVGGGILLAGAIFVLAGPIVRIFGHGANASVLQVLGLSVALWAPAIVPLALLEKRFDFRRRSSVQAAATIVASVLAVVAGVLGAGVWALVIRQVVFQGLLAILAWIAARGLVPPPEMSSRRLQWQRLKRRGAVGFLLFSLTDFVVFNADYLTVGRLTNAAQLGLYSLAFTIAFTPVNQFSSQIGRVLFPAAAASDPDTMRRRTLAGVRLSCLVLLPITPPVIVFAPALIPAVLGERWQGMVPAFQILVVVGVAHAIVNVIGESLSGTGQIGFRARINVVWMFAMIGALILLVRADGIRGAAFAHLALYLPVMAAYAAWGMRRLGSSAKQLGTAVGSVLAFVGVEAVVTAGAAVALRDVGIPELAHAAIAACLGVAAGGAYIATRGRETLYEARAFIAAVGALRSEFSGKASPEAVGQSSRSVSSTLFQDGQN